MTVAKPASRPTVPHFSSGPCAKRPGWNPQNLKDAALGRSHRAKLGKAKLKLAIDLTREVLQVPADYRIGIVPASDTGAFEMAMWNLLGPRGVDVFAWEVFGRIWLKDAVEQLKLADLRTFDAGWGELPDLAQADFSRDVLFTWNGTTSGVRVPDAHWVPDDRQGLTFCDATSAIFAQRIDFTRIDVLTYSWQKVLGGEGAHGILILSPRAYARLATHTPAWPLPKILRLKDKSGVLADVFEGITINTPSMLCVEDYADALSWAEGIGGLDALIARADRNAGVIYDWVARTPWLEPLAKVPATRSNTSVCLKLVDENVAAGGGDAPAAFVAAMCKLLEREGAAHDIAAYRGVPEGLRIWTGATIERRDLERLTEWIDWAYATLIDRYRG